jgi:hypothetical protein
MNLDLIIPSFRRAKLITTHKLLREGEYYFCIPESDLPEYRKVLPMEALIIHPDDVIGLPAKYNWLIREYQNKKKVDCFFMDDDLTSVVRRWHVKGDAKLTPDKIHAVICNCCKMAEDVGAYLFGFSERASPVMFQDSNPFAFRGFVPSKSFGFRYGHSLVFDERLLVRAEYDISLLNAFKYRILMKDQRFSFVNDQDVREGGIAFYRTSARMEETYKLLRKKYGDAICLTGGMKKGRYADDIFYNLTINLP